MLKLNLEGTQELIKALDQLEKSIENELEAALMVAAQPIMNQVKSDAPYLTGTYRRSITTETTEKRKDRAVVTIGTNVPYAARLEYGYSDTDALGRRYNQPPNPHWRPAIESQKRNAREEFAAAIRDVLRAQGVR